MRKDGAIDQAQSILSDFVKYVEEEQLLDMDVLIRGMKEHRSVQSQVCQGNLAWTTKSLSSPKLSSSVLFFVADSSMDTVKEDLEYVGLRCIICNASIQMEVKRGGKLTRNTHVLKSHLDSVHYGLATSVSSLYPTMAHLLKEQVKTRYQIKRRLTTQLKIRSAECLFQAKRNENGTSKFLHLSFWVFPLCGTLILISA